MPSELKKGQLRLDGANPMVFIEEEGGVKEQWAPERDSVVKAVSASVRSYLKTAESLAAGQYVHLRDKIPAYLADPGNILIAVCSDGIVVRYERRTHEKRSLAVTVLPQGIATGAAILSQNLVHIASPDAPLPDNQDFGVELKLSVHSPQQGASRDIVASRIWFQVTNLSPQEPNPPGAKPFCLLSVRNQLDLELHGVLLGSSDKPVPEQPFIARSSVRLAAGWDCIEVFPGTDVSAWNADSPPLWAERDLFGTLLIAPTAEARLSSLYTRAPARRA